MSEKDSVGNYLKSEQHKEKMREAHKKASDLTEKFKEPERKRPRITNEEAQTRINQQREMIHNENMQPPPPPEFVDEFGKPIFEDQSDIKFGGSMMPRRFKGTRAGVEVKPRVEYIKEEIGKFDSAPPQRAPPPMTMKQMENNDREFSHTTDLQFRDLTTEEYREYMYNNGGVLRILQPWKLAISRSGNHRVATRDGFSYIIVPGWIAIRVKKKVGAPAFTF